MRGERATRRRLLAATSAGIVGILAGCSDPGDDGDGEDEGDGEDDGEDEEGGGY